MLKLVRYFVVISPRVLEDILVFEFCVLIDIDGVNKEQLHVHCSVVEISIPDSKL